MATRKHDPSPKPRRTRKAARAAADAQRSAAPRKHAAAARVAPVRKRAKKKTHDDVSDALFGVGRYFPSAAKKR